MRPEFIVIGTSAGGVDAVTQILRGLKNPFFTPIAIVQHLPAYAWPDVDMVFGRYSRNPVLGIEDKMPIENGKVYFAPGGYHVLIEKIRTFALSQDDPVHFSRPSIDVFFESAAHVYGENLLGILLTGANEDGAEGIKTIQELGGKTIVQNPETAEINVMPSSALRMMKPDQVLDLKDIPNYLNQLCGGNSHE